MQLLKHSSNKAQNPLSINLILFKSSLIFISCDIPSSENIIRYLESCSNFISKKRGLLSNDDAAVTGRLLDNFDNTIKNTTLTIRLQLDVKSQNSAEKKLKPNPGVAQNRDEIENRKSRQKKNEERLKCNSTEISVIDEKIMGYRRRFF